MILFCFAVLLACVGLALAVWEPPPVVDGDPDEMSEAAEEEAYLRTIRPPLVDDMEADRSWGMDR